MIFFSHRKKSKDEILLPAASDDFVSKFLATVISLNFKLSIFLLNWELSINNFFQFSGLKNYGIIDQRKKSTSKLKKNSNLYGWLKSPLLNFYPKSIFLLLVNIAHKYVVGLKTR
jgi:hypothetical protein